MIIGGWTRIEIRSLRAALRMSQSEFAFAMGYSVHAVQRWEHLRVGHALRGKSPADLDAQLERLDERQLRRFEAELANRYAALPAGSDGREFAVDERDDVKRRQFGKLGAAVGAAWAAPGWGISADAARFGVGDARALMAAIDDLGTREQRVGGVSLVDEALVGVAKAQAMLDGCVYDDQAGQEMRTAAGNLACLAGWMAFDSAAHPLARHCYNEALALANEADDDDLTAHVCLNSALQIAALSRSGHARPQRALVMVSRARDLMRGRPPGRIHALIAMREAMAHAVAADSQGFSRAMATAWRELDHAIDHEPIAECPRWLRFVTPTEALHQESRGLSDLGEFTRSAELSTAAVNEVAGTRNATFYQAWDAVTRVKVGDSDGAIASGKAVLEAMRAKSVESTRTLKALMPVRNAVREPETEQFALDFDQLSKAVALS